MDAGDGLHSPQPKPLQDVLPSAQLLEHYRIRIEQFELERSDLLAAVDRCGVQRKEVHRLEWENRKRADEVSELQKALSDAQQFLFEERQRLLLLQAENDELKLQEIQDRQRIQQLLAMTQPLEQTITYNKQGGPPSSVTAFPQRPGTAGAAAAGVSSSGGERVLRTVILPTVDADFLLLKVESLLAQLNEQSQLHEERVAALLADRQLRAQEEERQRANLQLQVESLSKQIKQLEAALQANTRDYILARRQRQEAQDEAAAARAQMVADVSAARGQLAAIKRQARADTDKAAAAADAKMREYVDKFREQVRSREEELTNLSSLHTATKGAADTRIAALEGRLAKLLDANRQLELRRQLDVDGWAADVTALRKTLAVVDRKLLQMRLIDRLEDDERLDALLDQLEQRVPGAAAQQQAKAARPGRGGGAAAAVAQRGGSNRPQAGTRGGAVGGTRRAAAGGGRAAAAGAGGGRLRPQPAVRRRDQQQQQAAGVGAEASAGRLQDVAAAGQYSDDDDSTEDTSELRVAGALLAAELEGLTSSSGSAGDSSSVPPSIKSGLAAELRAVREQLAQLEARAGEKAARALAGLPQQQQQARRHLS